MQKNKYKYVSVGAMVAVMLLLGLYMWMTYRSAVSVQKSCRRAIHSAFLTFVATCLWYHRLKV